MKINVCLATDQNYVKYAAAVIASILKHAENDDELFFYILEDGLTDKGRQNVSDLKRIKDCDIYFIAPDISKLPKTKIINHISRASFFRLQLPNLLPDIARIIYLDCDMIVRSSLRELWDTDLENFIAAGVADYCANLVNHSKLIGCEHSVYITAGMGLLDLDKARKENLALQFMQTAEKLGDSATEHDQDIINATLKNKIKILPLKWNLTLGYYKRNYGLPYYSESVIAEAANNAAIVHFSGATKPWKWGRAKHPYWFEYYKALLGTKWQNEIWRGVVKKVFLPHKKGTGPAALFSKKILS
jgi:lipopolysaccharide biosynthesis glycosyltransferase